MHSEFINSDSKPAAMFRCQKNKSIILSDWKEWKKNILLHNPSFPHPDPFINRKEGKKEGRKEGGI
jgi:hypothetical protein